MQATKLSQMGYHVVVPDLYRGRLGVEAEEAQHLMDNLDWPAAVADVRNAAKYLRHMCALSLSRARARACVCVRVRACGRACVRVRGSPLLQLASCRVSSPTAAHTQHTGGARRSHRA